MHLQHLNNKCSIVIKMMPLVMNICNQGWICWDGGITKVIFCPTCTFLASSYHYIWTSNWFLQISSSEPEKQSKSTKAYAGAGVVWIYHIRSHTHPKEKQPSIMLLSLLSACTQCMKCWIIKFADQNSCDTSKGSVAVAAFSVNSIFLGGSWEQTAKVLGFLWVFSKGFLREVPLRALPHRPNVLAGKCSLCQLSPEENLQIKFPSSQLSVLGGKQAFPSRDSFSML